MKNRFNWVFEILRSEFCNAHAMYARGGDPKKDREELLASVRKIAASAKAREPEFPDEPQYEVFLNETIGALERFLREAAEREDLEPLLRETRQRLTAIEDDIRLHLK